MSTTKKVNVPAFEHIERTKHDIDQMVDKLQQLRDKLSDYGDNLSEKDKQLLRFVVADNVLQWMLEDIKMAFVLGNQDRMYDAFQELTTECERYM